MGSVMFCFYGICTNFRQENHQTLVDEQVADAVILINASQERPICGATIPAHHARMSFDDSGTVLNLDGCRVSVANPSSHTVSYDNSFETVPNLTEMMFKEGHILGRAHQALISTDPNLIAARFDFNSGVFRACKSVYPSSGAMITIEVNTEGPPIIELKPFRYSAWHYEATTDVVVICVENRHEGLGGDREGFWLHYLLADNRPPCPYPIPTLDTMPDCLFGNSGPGCSPSNYP